MRAIAFLFVLAGLAMIPAILGQPMLHQSFWIDVVWADQFTEQLRAGVLYPRWLPDSHGGLGSPVFYYYPPLAFYVAGLFGFVLPAYASVIAAFWAALLASGVTMFLWLRGWARHPLLGAMFYMLAPYHIYDFYARGALAEFTGVALLPLVALGVRRANDGRYFLLALSYAALIATHLPLALLTSLFLICPYGLWLCRTDWRALLPAAKGIALGLALSAIYLVPALALDEYRDTAKLWAIPLLQPEAWNLFRPSQWVEGSSVHHILRLTGAIGGAALLLALWLRSFWPALALGTVLLSAGALPLLWSLLGFVQFPWRMLAIAEFGLATAFALLSVRAGVAFLLMAPLLLISAHTVHVKPAKRDLTILLRDHPDVPENLPRGAPPWTNWHSEWALDLAGRNPGRVFYFPAWRCETGAARKEPSTLLLAPCDRRLAWTWAEIAGALLSLLGLAGLTLLRSERRGRAEIVEHEPAIPL